MLRGTRSIYVDYVDYDEIAHHAGVLRPESLEALEAVDGVLRQLEMVATVAPRQYHFVVLSDHGQAQGATFPTGTARSSPTSSPGWRRSEVASSDDDVEGWGRTRALVDELATGDGVSERDACATRPGRWNAATRTQPDTSWPRRGRQASWATRPSTSSAPATWVSSTCAARSSASSPASSTPGSRA